MQRRAIEEAVRRAAGRTVNMAARGGGLRTVKITGIPGI
jgi:hypothetical protein